MPGNSAPSEFPVFKHSSPTRAEFAAWPTNPAKLRALLLSPGGQALPEGEEGAEEVNGETPDGLVFHAYGGAGGDPDGTAGSAAGGMAKSSCDPYNAVSPFLALTHPNR